jgi:hypothetical protein
MMKTDSWLFRPIAALCLSGLLAALTPAVCAASTVKDKALGENAQRDQTVRLSIEGISASVGEDEPRVLTILPWRSPTLPRRPRAELESAAPELVQPLDPFVLERHREFRGSLGGADPGGRSGRRQ